MKAFHGKRGTNFWGKIYWVTVLHGELMIRSCHGQGSFTNAFSNNLNTVSLKYCKSIMKRYTLEDKALTIQQN